MNQSFDNNYAKQVGASPSKLASVDADNVQFSVAGAHDAVGELVSRIGRLADRLCGEQPLNGGLAAGNPAAFGVFPEIKAACSQIDAAVADANAFLNRIEAHLPATPVR